MPVAIIDPAGAILGVHPKPRPTMVIPPDGRMLGYNPPSVDMDLVDVVAIEPVPPEATEVGFTVTPKAPGHVVTVQTERIKAQIEVLERTAILPRPLREYMVQDLESRAQADGVSLEQLRAANFNYCKVKALDVQIAALRAQIP